MMQLAEIRRSAGRYLTQPIVGLLAKTPLTPNAVTWFGFLLTVGAAALVATQHLMAAGFMVLLAGFFDILDGALARLTGRVTRFGAILDSTLDRLSEAVLLLGLLLLYARGQAVAESLLVGLVLVGSLLVSYLRARVEAAGIDGRVGICTRTERVIILALGLIFSHFDYVLVVALAVIAVFSFFTVGQRLYYAWRQTGAD